METILKDIKETVEGYEVKELRWLPLDNIIVGLVKPLYSNPKAHEGFESCQWKRNGYPTNRNRGRKDLILKMVI